jgi:hypothetical protein
MTVPPLKTEPKFGYFPWWPEDGNAWVHPEDVATARAMIPSNRVFCRDGSSGGFLVLQYGDLKLRVRRTLWQEVEPEGLRIGDWVEVLTRGMLNEPRLGVVCEMLWDDRARAIRYQINDNGKLIEQLYGREDLQNVEPPTAHEQIVIAEPEEDAVE